MSTVFETECSFDNWRYADDTSKSVIELSQIGYTDWLESEVK